MSMTFLEELTIRAYSEIGIFPHVLMRPTNWLKARRTIARLVASNLDPADSISISMPEAEAGELLLLAGVLSDLRKRYVANG